MIGVTGSVMIGVTRDCAVHLSTSLEGAALEVLAQLDSATRDSYYRLAQTHVLEQR